MLYWKFDESSGTTAFDSTTNHLDGNYVSDLILDGGTALLPTPSSTSLPPPIIQSGFADPYSLLFTMSSAYRQAVKYAPAPTDATLRMSNNITLSVWFRATTTDSNGSELVSMSDDYLLRIKKSTSGYQLQMSKAIGTSTFADCQGPQVPSTVFLDGTWHHFAGTISSTTGMAIYLDGQQVMVPVDGGMSACSNTASATNTANIVYHFADGGTTRQFCVARNGNNSGSFDFDGNLDEVRVYNRVLTPAEILTLAQGGL